MDHQLILKNNSSKNNSFFEAFSLYATSIVTQKKITLHWLGDNQRNLEFFSLPDGSFTIFRKHIPEWNSTPQVGDLLPSMFFSHL